MSVRELLNQVYVHLLDSCGDQDEVDELHSYLWATPEEITRQRTDNILALGEIA